MGLWSNKTYLGSWTANGRKIARFSSVAGCNSDFFFYMEAAGGCVDVYFHRAMKCLVTKIQVPVTAVDNNVLWCVREDAMRCTTFCFKREEGPFLPLLLPRDDYYVTLDIQEILTVICISKLNVIKFFDLTQERNHTMDRTYKNCRYVYVLM